ncbi:MAG: hypothetical protein JWM71_959, partial [Solirubrobacteraceae bacterium]|nr:hypothetical protein [Solirubrobacteraceae bacterium]
PSAAERLLGAEADRDERRAGSERRAGADRRQTTG